MADLMRNALPLRATLGIALLTVATATDMIAGLAVGYVLNASLEGLMMYNASLSEIYDDWTKRRK